MKYSVKLYIRLYAQLYTFTGHTTNNNVVTSMVRRQDFYPQ